MWGPAALSGLLAALFCFLVNFSPTAATSYCCVEDEERRTNCSFQYYRGRNHNEETAQCQVIYGSENQYSMDGCPAYAYVPEDDVPAGVVNLETSFFYTSCSATISPSQPLRFSSCKMDCDDSTGNHYLGLNITFQLEKFTAEYVERIEVSLDVNDDIHAPWCNWIDLGINGLARAAAEQHTFYFDGFVGLNPSGTYTVSVKTLPTDIHLTNQVKKTVRTPKEECWTPQIIHHKTPFAINLTLLKDDFNFSKYYVTTINLQDTSSYVRKLVDFTKSELYQYNGAWGTNITFDCLVPGSYNIAVRVDPSECPHCRRKHTVVSVTAIPPTISNCPTNITKVVELGTAESVSSITWLEPTIEFSCGAREGDYSSNHSHDPSDATFRINQMTRVSYVAWQFDKMAECSFNVNIIAVDTTPPSIVYCPPNITVVAEAGEQSLTVVWEQPRAADVSPLSFVPTINNGSSFPAGKITAVQYKIVDASGNINDDCVFHVFVKAATVASSLVIILSCVAGLCLVLLAAFIVYCKYCGTHSGIPDEASLYSPVKGNIGIPVIGSKLDIGQIYYQQEYTVSPLQRSASSPSFCSEWSQNNIATDPSRRHLLSELQRGEGHSSESRLAQPESVVSTHSSQFTGSYDASPVSLESNC